MTPTFLPAAQRRLFFALWTLVALGVAFWLLPGPERWTRDRLGAPKVTLGPELRSMFTAGRVVEVPAESFLVELELGDDYRTTVPEAGRDFSVGYQYRKGGSILRHGHLPVRVSRERQVRLRLPNLERSHPAEIVLSLLP